MDTRILLGRFIQLYPDIRERLRRRLGSADLADEALSEVYVKLSTSEKSYSVRNSAAYLFRLTLNAAFELRRSAGRRGIVGQIEAALDVPDPAPGIARIAEGRQELELMEQAIDSLSERRRFILVAARLHDRSCREIAVELGLSTRMVEIELRRALDHCADYLVRGSKNNFAKTNRQTSYH
ncbi:RNA polymerase sigma factor [Erythrobacter aureus]|uniref:RNA polymerase sigma factor n=1 Tax=Erythrobacter aureus TaxID=2182384 RepID=UPI003A92140E